LSRPVPADDLERVTALLAPFFGRWRGARIVVTGASGFFGSWLVETFHHANRALGLGARMLGVAGPGEDLAQRCPHLLALDDVDIVQSDIRELRGAVRAQAPGWARVDAVVHAAIYVNAADFDRRPLATLESAVLGTWETLELAREAGARRFLFVSSGAVYGAQPAATGLLDEEHPAALDPCSLHAAYGEGKRIGETLCAAYLRQHGLSTSVARPFAFVGPHLPLDKHFAVGNFIRDALRGGPVTVESDGTPHRSYLYAADLAVWLWKILTDGTPGRAYNVGSERALPLGELAALVARLGPPGVGVEVRGAAVPGRPPSRYVPSTARARDELGLAETFSLEEAVRRTLAWYGTGAP
jgi:dTDP-glucose 4,6-dehydratase